MIVGYGSKESQRLLEKAGCQKIYIDVLNEAKSERPRLKEAVEAVQPGDLLLVRRLDCLGTTVWAVLQTIHRLVAKGVKVKSIEEDFSIGESQEGIQLLNTLVELERRAIQSRSHERSQTIERNNSKNGRPKKLGQADLKLAKILYESQQFTVEEICKRLGISRGTFYKYFSPNAKS